MNIEYIGKDQIWQNETTNYWFSIDGIKYAVSDNNGNLKLLDSEGYPIDECSDHAGILNSLLPHYCNHLYQE